jgi:hypothetical protein
VATGWSALALASRHQGYPRPKWVRPGQAGEPGEQRKPEHSEGGFAGEVAVATRLPEAADDLYEAGLGSSTPVKLREVIKGVSGLGKVRRTVDIKGIPDSFLSCWSSVRILGSVNEIGCGVRGGE